jgi:hypothetical protein
VVLVVVAAVAATLTGPEADTGRDGGQRWARCDGHSRGSPSAAGDAAVGDLVWWPSALACQFLGWRRRWLGFLDLQDHGLRQGGRV